MGEGAAKDPVTWKILLIDRLKRTQTDKFIPQINDDVIIYSFWDGCHQQKLDGQLGIYLRAWKFPYIFELHRVVFKNRVVLAHEIMRPV